MRGTLKTFVEGDRSQLELWAPAVELQVHLPEGVQVRHGLVRGPVEVRSLVLVPGQEPLPQQEPYVLLPSVSVEAAPVDDAGEGAGGPAVGEYLPVYLVQGPLSLQLDPSSSSPSLFSASLD